MKYWRTFLLGIETEFISRVNIFGWFLNGLIPVVVLVLVWFTVLGSRTSIGGFSKGDFIIYYLFTVVGWYVVGGSFGYTVGKRIKEGALSISLLKPYNVILAQCLQEQAWKVLSFCLSVPIMIILLYIYRDIIIIHITTQQFFLLILALIFGGINFAFMEALVGLSALWLVDIWPIANLKDMAVGLFGGLMAPLALMPHAVQWLAQILPFKYTFYVPVSILLSKSQDPIRDVEIQILYIVALFFIYKIIWHRGIKKYEAIGI